MMIHLRHQLVNVRYIWQALSVKIFKIWTQEIHNELTSLHKKHVFMIRTSKETPPSNKKKKNGIQTLKIQWNIAYGASVTYDSVIFHSFDENIPRELNISLVIERENLPVTNMCISILLLPRDFPKQETEKRDNPEKKI